MNKEKTILLDNQMLFTSEEMGLSISEWEHIQKDLREKLFLRTSFFFPGNTPSLKNSKEILQIYNTSSNCCHTPVMRLKQGTRMIALCSSCKKPVALKKPILGPSKPVREYRDSHLGDFLKNKPRFILESKKYSKPYLLGFYYIRDSERKFDYSNAAHILLDMMKQSGYFEDDDCDTIMDYPLGYHVDKIKAGAYVIFLPNTFFKSLMNLI